MTIIKAAISILLSLSAFFSALPPPRSAPARNGGGGDFASINCTNIDAIYQLGNSESDTGNLILENPSAFIARPPYGETYFHNATGRCSNGLMLIDFITKKIGLPFLEPYLNNDAKFESGVNFAVAGATALPSEVLAQKNVALPFTNSSLSVQLDWMSSYFDGLCHNDCADKMKSSLFIIGEIGANDYSFALSQGRTLNEVKAMVPEVVQAIRLAILSVISYGATRVLVPGNLATGCYPSSLTEFGTNNLDAYDENNCLKWLNDLSMYHNDQLKLVLQELRQEHPSVGIVYGDYYNNHLQLHYDAALLGFDEETVQKACCGIGGDYNYDLTQICGDPGVPTCPDPDTSINWDGLHLTQRAYQVIAEWLMNDVLLKLHC